MLTMFTQLTSAAIFQLLDPEDHTFTLWLYHCFVTAFTVGYGDVTNGSQMGRLWSSFHILLSVAMLSEILATLDVLAKDRKATLARCQQLSRKLDRALLNQVRACSTAIRTAS